MSMAHGHDEPGHDGDYGMLTASLPTDTRMG